MLLPLLLVLQSAGQVAAWDGLPIPDAVGVAAARYIGCISDPVEELTTTGQPADPAARKALVDKARTDCLPVRAEVAAEMDTKLATTPGWTAPDVRQAKIARMLDAANERVAFSAINNEEFRALASEVMMCVNAGRKDCDKVGRRLMPATK